MRTFAIGFICVVLGYLVGAFGGGFLISVLSSNRHDRSMEAAMTGAFIIGPLTAIVTLAVALFLSRR